MEQEDITSRNYRHLFFWARIEKSITKRTQHTTNSGEVAQPKWNREIMPICGLPTQVTTEVLWGSQ